MPKVCWLVLGLCAVLTYRQVPTWASDQALWSQALSASPTAVRPAVNLAADAIVHGRYDEARWWIAHARVLLVQDGRQRERIPVGQLLDRQELWIDAFSASR